MLVKNYMTSHGDDSETSGGKESATLVQVDNPMKMQDEQEEEEEEEEQEEAQEDKEDFNYKA